MGARTAAPGPSAEYTTTTCVLPPTPCLPADRYLHHPGNNASLSVAIVAPNSLIGAVLRNRFQVWFDRVVDLQLAVDAVRFKRDKIG